MNENLMLTLSKVLPELLMPFGLALILMTVGLLFSVKFPRASRRVHFVALAILIFFSLPFSADFLIYSLESRHPAIAAEQAPKADAIVLLGGSVSPATAPRAHPQLNVSGDRLMMTLRLFHAGKAPVILISGGAVDLNSAANSEASNTSSILQAWGIPASSIIEERSSKNTYQNMKETVALMEQHSFDSMLLVTSAMHMPRAALMFASSDLAVTPVPSHQVVTLGGTSIRNRWVPNAISLSGSSKAIREYMGLAYSRIRGHFNHSGAAGNQAQN